MLIYWKKRAIFYHGDADRAHTVVVTIWRLHVKGYISHFCRPLVYRFALVLTGQWRSCCGNLYTAVVTPVKGALLTNIRIIDN